VEQSQDYHEVCAAVNRKEIKKNWLKGLTVPLS
jgi:hypothetical protein